MSWLHQLNHTLARVDAREAVPGVQPLKRWVMPLMAAGLGGAQITYDALNTKDPTIRTQRLQRDVLAITGSLVGLVGARKLLNQMFSSGGGHLHIPGLAHRHSTLWIERLFPKKAPKPNSTPQPSAAEKRVLSLFKSPKCDHGWQGGTELQTLALGGVGGGMLGGWFSDWFSAKRQQTDKRALHNDVGEGYARHNFSHKLREFNFQYFGNISMCTLAILVFGSLGHRVGQRAVYPVMQGWANRATEKRLMQMLAAEKGDIRLMPTQATEHLEALFQLGRQPKTLQKTVLEHLTIKIENRERDIRQLRDSVQGVVTETTQQAIAKKEAEMSALTQQSQRFSHVNLQEQAGRETLLKALLQSYADAGPLANLDKAEKTALIQQTLKHVDAGLLKQAHTLWRKAIGDTLRTDIQTVLKSEPQKTKRLADLAQERIAMIAERVGIAGGVLAGVVGGAAFSNGLNGWLEQRFNLPTFQPTLGLFRHQHTHGWLQGNVGERGIRKEDALLHLDDVPSALYIAGVHAVEAFIALLYGMSGLLAGTAGPVPAEFTKSPERTDPQHARSVMASRVAPLFAYPGVGPLPMVTVGVPEPVVVMPERAAPAVENPFLAQQEFRP